MVTTLPEQLITQAEDQVRAYPVIEANVRRAVSTAYYALFHLLIRSAISNWIQAEHHPQLARTFEHRRMKEASLTLLRDIKVKDAEAADKAERYVRPIGERYGQLATRAFSRPGYFAAIAASVLIASGWLAWTNLQSGFMPIMDEGGFILDYKAKPGAALESKSVVAEARLDPCTKKIEPGARP